MRRLALALAVMLIASPVMAQDNSAVSTSGWNFGSASCGTFSCNVNQSNISQFISTANGCLASRLAFKGEDGSAFVDYLGADPSGCLTSKEVQKSSSGMAISPKCCVVKLKNNTCRIGCYLLGNK